MGPKTLAVSVKIHAYAPTNRRWRTAYNRHTCRAGRQTKGQFRAAKVVPIHSRNFPRQTRRIVLGFPFFIFRYEYSVQAATNHCTRYCSRTLSLACRRAWPSNKINKHNTGISQLIDGKGQGRGHGHQVDGWAGSSSIALLKTR